MKRLLLLAILAWLTVEAHANSYFPVLGDNAATLEESHGKPQKTEHHGEKGRRLIWETKYGYALCCDFDYEDHLQAVQICMYKNKTIPIRWAFQEMALWTGTDEDDWQEIQPNSGDRYFLAKDKSGKQVDATLYSDGANLTMVYHDWLGEKHW